jgi:hypothetical protein
MSVQNQLIQELVALAICGGSHRVVFCVGEDRWDLPVIDGRVGQLVGAVEGSGETMDLAEELAMLCSLDDLILRRERHPGAKAQMRWVSAASLAKQLDKQAVGRIGEMPEVSLEAPTTMAALDALERLSGMALKAGSAQEVLDASVNALGDLFPQSVMLYSAGADAWIGPDGALLGTTDRLDQALHSGVVATFPPCGEAYESALGRPPLVVLLPMSSQVVMALAWADDGVQPRPVVGLLIQRLCRVALRTYATDQGLAE